MPRLLQFATDIVNSIFAVFFYVFVVVSGLRVLKGFD
jgi:hypothetical protein